MALKFDMGPEIVSSEGYFLQILGREVYIDFRNFWFGRG